MLWHPSLSNILLAAVTSAVLLLVVRPLLVILWEIHRYPEKAQMLRVVVGRTREFCERHPELLHTPRFHAELLAAALYALEQARKAPFPLSETQALYTVLLGVHKSGLLGFDDIARVEQLLRVKLDAQGKHLRAIT
jgi:hypothetical protein